MDVRWTLQAVDDLKAIRDFIARDSEHYAQVVVARLFETALQISQFPDSGRIVPEKRDPDIRELVRSPYRVVYRRKQDIVEIITVHHSARPIPGADSDRE